MLDYFMTPDGVVAIAELTAIVGGILMALINLGRLNASQRHAMILEAEAQADQSRERLLNVPAAVVRQIWCSEIPKDFSDFEVQAVEFHYQSYAKLSRLYGLISSRHNHAGMSYKEREERLDQWLNGLKPALHSRPFLFVHERAKRLDEFDDSFRAEVDRRLEMMNAMMA